MRSRTHLGAHPTNESIKRHLSAEEATQLQLGVAEAKSEPVMEGSCYLFLLLQRRKSHDYPVIPSVLQKVHELPEMLN